MQVVVFADPNGPLSPRKNAFERINARETGPAGVKSMSMLVAKVDLNVESSLR